MNYIRKAVELAEGWELGVELLKTPCVNVVLLDDTIPNLYLDALAAQLVRQVESIPHDWRWHPAVYVLTGSTDIYVYKRRVANVFGPDRTMNTIKAIVDSKVLE